MLSFNVHENAGCNWTYQSNWKRICWKWNYVSNFILCGTHKVSLEIQIYAYTQYTLYDGYVLHICTIAPFGHWQLQCFSSCCCPDRNGGSYARWTGPLFFVFISLFIFAELIGCNMMKKKKPIYARVIIWFAWAIHCKLWWKYVKVKYMTDKIPMKRCGLLEEMANMVAFIASKQASFTTAFTFDATGGRATY